MPGRGATPGRPGSPFVGPGAAELGCALGDCGAVGRGVTIDERPVGTGRSVGISPASTGAWRGRGRGGSGRGGIDPAAGADGPLDGRGDIFGAGGVTVSAATATGAEDAPRGAASGGVAAGAAASGAPVDGAAGAALRDTAETGLRLGAGPASGTAAGAAAAIEADGAAAAGGAEESVTGGVTAGAAATGPGAAGTGPGAVGDSDAAAASGDGPPAAGGDAAAGADFAACARAAAAFPS